MCREHTTGTKGPVRPISIPECDPSVFELFVEFLFAESYNTRIGSVGWSTVNLDERGKDVQWGDKAHILAWILGEALGATRFKNFAMLKINATYNENSGAGRPIHPAAVATVYGNSPKNSPIRRIFKIYLFQKWGLPGKIVSIGTADPLWNKMWRDNANLGISLLMAVGQHGNQNERRNYPLTMANFLEPEEQVEVKQESADQPQNSASNPITLD